jgi:hypothetical protein
MTSLFPTLIKLLPLFFSCLLMATGLYGQAATPSIIKEFRYDYLQLKSDLPYQEVFKIKGNRNVFLGIADAATLTISTKGETDRKYFWWAKKETNPAQETDFEFFINHELRFAVGYDLTFEFYDGVN